MHYRRDSRRRRLTAPKENRRACVLLSSCQSARCAPCAEAAAAATVIAVAAIELLHVDETFVLA